jgi:hypothetical protein
LPTDYGLETIIVYDNTIYIGSRTALYILNISNPAIPVIQSESIRENLFGGCDPVVVKGNYAYSTIKIIENVCGRVNVESALLVYDVTNKSNPQNVYQQTMAMPNGLGYKDNYLFVCDEGTDQITVFDISTPEIPKATTYAVPLIDPVDLIVDDQKMIVSSKTDFFIYDISDIQSIKKIAQIGR